MTPTRGGGRRLARARGVRMLLISALVLLLANLAAQPARALQHTSDTDWLAFAAGARILDSGSTCLYCHDEEAGVEAAALGYTPAGSGFPNPFANPPLVAWLLRPLGRLPLPDGLMVLELASLLALGGTGLAMRRRIAATADGAIATAVTIAALASLPGAETLALGQWDALLVAAGVAAVLLAERDRPVAAGALLALVLVKPQLVWLVVPALVVCRSWRALLGFASVAALWAGTAVAIVGWSGIRQWADLILTRHVGETARTVGVPGAIAAATRNGTAGFAAAAALGVAAVIAMVLLRDRLRADPSTAIALGVAASLTCAPHVFADDLLLLAIPLLVLARSAPHRALGWGLLLSCGWVLDAYVLGGDVAVEALVTAGISAELALTLRKGGAGEARHREVVAGAVALTT